MHPIRSWPCSQTTDVSNELETELPSRLPAFGPGSSAQPETWGLWLCPPYPLHRSFSLFSSPQSRTTALPPAHRPSFVIIDGTGQAQARGMVPGPPSRRGDRYNSRAISFALSMLLSTAHRPCLFPIKIRTTDRSPQSLSTEVNSNVTNSKASGDQTGRNKNSRPRAPLGSRFTSLESCGGLFSAGSP